MPKRIQVKQIGPLVEADITFGDLTVLVGPQATGKSIFLQLLKLVVDRPHIHQELAKFNVEWANDSGGREFFTIYFGDGMEGVWRRGESELLVDGAETSLPELAKRSRAKAAQRLFYIPAQRVMSLRDGQTRPFTDYRVGDPFTLREFSEQVHRLLQGELLTGKDALFPRVNRLKEAYRRAITNSVFGKFELRTDTDRMQKRIVLSSGQTHLPYLVWSAGQREFVPLLLGLYWLIPPARTAMREQVRWVVVEEPEMGLHPEAISVFVALVMELLQRGYRVVLSTHSPHVLDVVWGLGFLQEHQGRPKDVLDMLGMPNGAELQRVAESALEKEVRVYYFQRNGRVKDISGLDPAAADEAESGWGGLTEFSSRVGDVVSRVAGLHENSAGPK